MTTWFPIFGAPAAWLLQLLVLWLAAEWSCAASVPTRAIVAWASATALALALGALFAAPRRAGDARTAAFFSSGIFLLAIAATAAPALLFAPCQALR